MKKSDLRFVILAVWWIGLGTEHLRHTDHRAIGLTCIFAFLAALQLWGTPPIAFWRWLTYWKVPCEGCNGTGICGGESSRYPHSCCGDCGRKLVDASTLPAGYSGVHNGRATVGDGIMWRRPWSRKQVQRSL